MLKHNKSCSFLISLRKPETNAAPEVTRVEMGLHAAPRAVAARRGLRPQQKLRKSRDRDRNRKDVTVSRRGKRQNGETVTAGGNSDEFFKSLQLGDTPARADPVTAPGRSSVVSRIGIPIKIIRTLQLNAYYYKLCFIHS